MLCNKGVKDCCAPQSGLFSRAVFCREDARFVHKRSSVVQKQVHTSCVICCATSVLMHRWNSCDVSAQDSQFQAAFVILQHLWNKEYEVDGISHLRRCSAVHIVNTWLSVHALCYVQKGTIVMTPLTNVAQTVWSTFSSVKWAEPMPQLIKAISDKQRQHVLQLVSWAYSSIQPERLASLTGTSSADVLQSMLLSSL